MSADLLLDRRSPLYRQLAEAAGARRCVFVAGLPGVGKSLLIQQLSLIAAEAGRRVYLLQWDVARGAFETPDVFARYPETDGITHAAIRKATGVWVREAVGRWDAEQPDARALLIGELPLIGNRLIELVQRLDDAVEPLLAGPRSLFFIPVPSAALRQAIEQARAREMAEPRHERERANANPGVIDVLWAELALVAERLGVAEREGAVDYDPDVYVRTYQRLLRHRQIETLALTDVLPVRGSAQEHTTLAGELVPTPAEAAEAIVRVERLAPEELERQVGGWYLT